MTRTGKKNVYQCRACLGIICTVDRDDGVTPFMIPCKATAGCKGPMQSGFYIAHPMLVATFEWYRPGSTAGLNEHTKDHVERGGLLLRELTEPAENSP